MTDAVASRREVAQSRRQPMFNTAYEFLTSEPAQQCYSYIYQAVAFLCGGTSLAVWQWVRGVVGRNPEFQRVIEAVSSDSAKPNHIAIKTTTAENTKFETKRPLTGLAVQGTGLFVNLTPAETKRTWLKSALLSEVVYLDGEDQSAYYSQPELRKILSAAKSRQAKIDKAEREFGRKVVASHVTPPKKG